MDVHLEDGLRIFEGDHVAAAAYVILKEEHGDKFAGPKATRPAPRPAPALPSLQSLAARQVFKQGGFFRRQPGDPTKFLLRKDMSDTEVGLASLPVPLFADAFSQLDFEMEPDENSLDKLDRWKRSIPVHNRYRQVVLGHAYQVADKYNVFWHYMKALIEDYKAPEGPDVSTVLFFQRRTLSGVRRQGVSQGARQFHFQYLELVAWPKAPSPMEVIRPDTTAGKLHGVPIAMAYSPDDKVYHAFAQTFGVPTYAAVDFENYVVRSIDDTLAGLALHHDMTLLFSLLFSTNATPDARNRRIRSETPLNFALKFEDVGLAFTEEDAVGSAKFHLSTGELVQRQFHTLIARSWDGAPILQALWNIALYNIRSFVQHRLLIALVVDTTTEAERDRMIERVEEQWEPGPYDLNVTAGEPVRVNHGYVQTDNYDDWPDYNGEDAKHEGAVGLFHQPLPSVQDYVTLSFKFLNRSTHMTYHYFLDPRVTLSVACQHAIRAIDEYRSVAGHLTGNDFVFEFYVHTIKPLPAWRADITLEPVSSRWDDPEAEYVGTRIPVFWDREGQGKSIYNTLYRLWLFYKSALPLEDFVTRYRPIGELGPDAEKAFLRFELEREWDDTRYIALKKKYLLLKDPNMSELDVIQAIARGVQKRRPEEYTIPEPTNYFLNEPVFLRFSEIAPKKFLP